MLRPRGLGVRDLRLLKNHDGYSTNSVVTLRFLREHIGAWVWGGS